jgi:adenylosuccinate lyase
MHAVARGGDRQALHERIRRHSLEAAKRMKEGAPVDLLERIAGDRAFGLSQHDLAALSDPRRFVGRAPEQVASFLERHVAPILAERREEAVRLADAELHV